MSYPIQHALFEPWFLAGLRLNNRIIAAPMIAVMGAEGAVQILHRRDIAAISEEDRVGYIRQLSNDYESKNINPNYAVETGEIDRVISPEGTREAITSALRVLRDKDRRRLRHKFHSNGPI